MYNIIHYYYTSNLIHNLFAFINLIKISKYRIFVFIMAFPALLCRMLLILHFNISFFPLMKGTCTCEKATEQLLLLISFAQDFFFFTYNHQGYYYFATSASAVGEHKKYVLQAVHSLHNSHTLPLKVK